MSSENKRPTDEQRRQHKLIVQEVAGLKKGSRLKLREETRAAFFADSKCRALALAALVLRGMMNKQKMFSAHTSALLKNGSLGDVAGNVDLADMRNQEKRKQRVCDALFAARTELGIAEADTYSPLDTLRMTMKARKVAMTVPAELLLLHTTKLQRDLDICSITSTMMMPMRTAKDELIFVALAQDNIKKLIPPAIVHAMINNRAWAARGKNGDHAIDLSSLGTFLGALMRPKGNSKALAKQMLEMHEDPEERARLFNEAFGCEAPVEEFVATVNESIAQTFSEKAVTATSKQRKSRTTKKKTKRKQPGAADGGDGVSGEVEIVSRTVEEEADYSTFFRVTNLFETTFEGDSDERFVASKYRQFKEKFEQDFMPAMCLAKHSTIATVAKNTPSSRKMLYKTSAAGKPKSMTTPRSVVNGESSRVAAHTSNSLTEDADTRSMAKLKSTAAVARKRRYWSAAELTALFETVGDPTTNLSVDQVLRLFACEGAIGQELLALSFENAHRAGFFVDVEAQTGEESAGAMLREFKRCDKAIVRYLARLTMYVFNITYLTKLLREERPSEAALAKAREKWCTVPAMDTYEGNGFDPKLGFATRI